jgi:hypothetical protein|tara:strand:+ start:8612 stop:9583 length:972 start_codon:yes stop_codon:yes gene_type:complete
MEPLIGAAIKAGGALVSGIGGIFAAGRLKRAAQDNRKRLADEKVAALSAFGDIRDTVTSGYQDYINQLQMLPELGIDRSFADAALQASRDRMVGAGGGRVAGEELLREEARRTTANQIEAARAAAGDGAGLLGAISLAGMSEAGRMREIDIQSQAQRERELTRAQESLEQGLITRSEFERIAQQNEFRAATRKGENIASATLGFAERQGQLGFQEMGIEKEYNQALAAQRMAIAQARAQQISGVFNAMGGTASSFADFAQSAGAFNQPTGLGATTATPNPANLSMSSFGLGVLPSPNTSTSASSMFNLDTSGVQMPIIPTYGG